MGSTSVDMSNWNIEKKKEALEKAKERKGILIAAIGDIADELKEKSEELNQLNLNVPWLEKKIQEHEKSKIE